jgi:hypothetical protein
MYPPSQQDDWVDDTQPSQGDWVDDSPPQELTNVRTGFEPQPQPQRQSAMPPASKSFMQSIADYIPQPVKDIYNKTSEPLTDLPTRAGKAISDYLDPTQYGTYDPRRYLYEAPEALGGVLSGLSSPQNLALTAATMGSGAAAGAGYGATARGLNLAGKAMSLPVAAHGAYQISEGQTIPEKLMGGLELAGGAYGAMAKTPPIKQPGIRSITPETEFALGKSTAERMQELVDRTQKSNEMIKAESPMLTPEEIPAAQERLNQLMEKASASLQRKEKGVHLTVDELKEGQYLDKKLREVHFGKTSGGVKQDTIPQMTPPEMTPVGGEQAYNETRPQEAQPGATEQQQYDLARNKFNMGQELPAEDLPLNVPPPQEAAPPTEGNPLSRLVKKRAAKGTGKPSTDVSQFPDMPAGDGKPAVVGGIRQPRKEYPGFKGIISDEAVAASDIGEVQPRKPFTERIKGEKGELIIGRGGDEFANKGRKTPKAPEEPVYGKTPYDAPYNGTPEDALQLANDLPKEAINYVIQSGDSKGASLIRSVLEAMPEEELNKPQWTALYNVMSDVADGIHTPPTKPLQGVQGGKFREPSRSSTWERLFKNEKGELIIPGSGTPNKPRLAAEFGETTQAEPGTAHAPNSESAQSRVPRAANEGFGAFGGPPPGKSKLIEDFMRDPNTPTIERKTLEPFAKPGMGSELWNASRSLQSIDLPGVTSAALRQSRPLAFTTDWFKAWGKAFKAFGSKGALDEINSNIGTLPHFKPRYEPVYNKAGDLVKYLEKPSIAEEMGVKMTDVLSRREEAIASSLAERIPGYGRYVSASNRAYTAFLNDLRANKFEQLMEGAKALGKNPEMDLTLGKEIAHFVNNATGRGSLGAAEGTKVAELLGNTLYSPRALSARLSFFDPRNYLKADPMVRNEYIKGLARIGASWGAFTGLGMLMGGKTSTDPTNPDFGKVRFGDTRFDPGAGMAQLLVLGSREWFQGTTSSTGRAGEQGKFTPFGKGPYSDNMISLLVKYARNQLHPSLGAMVDIGMATRKNPVDLTDKALQLVAPMFLTDIADAAKEDPAVAFFFAPVLSSLGMSAQTYEKGDFGKPKITPHINSFLKSTLGTSLPNTNFYPGQLRGR